MKISSPAAVLLLLVPLPAQEADQPQGKVEPEVIREPTAEERIRQLEADLAKLREELEFLRRLESRGGLPARVERRLEQRELIAGSFTVREGPQPVKKHEGTRLLGDAEKEKLPDDTVFAVNGLPVSEAEFEDALRYLRSYPTEQSEEELAKRAVLELVRLKAAQAAFPETAKKARSKILQAQRQLEEGKAFEDVALAMSDCPSSSQGGDLGYYDRETMDFFFTKESFRLKVGEVSGVVPTTFGYHIIKLTGREKGATPAEDRVKASHILALYYPDQTEVSQVRMSVNNGDVDLAFADDEYREHTPDAFRK